MQRASRSPNVDAPNVGRLPVNVLLGVNATAPAYRVANCHAVAGSIQNRSAEKNCALTLTGYGRHIAMQFRNDRQGVNVSAILGIRGWPGSAALGHEVVMRRSSLFSRLPVCQRRCQAWRCGHEQPEAHQATEARFLESPYRSPASLKDTSLATPFASQTTASSFSYILNCSSGRFMYRNSYPRCRSPLSFVRG
jgi:hypothetical protein